MAVFMRSSSFMRYNVLINVSNHRLLKYALQHKLPSWSVVNSTFNMHNYSTVTTKNQKKDFTSRYYSSLILGITQQRSISTENQSKLEAISSQHPTVTNKVIFVESETPSTELLTDSATTISSQATVVPNVSEVLSEDVASTLLTDLPLVVSDLVEPSLSSLGLVNYTPVGLVQAFLEVLHINAGMPWWLSIVVATTIARILIFPLFVKTQQNAARMTAYMPQMQFLQNKFNEARRSGNSMEAAKAGNELMQFIKKHNASPFKTMLVPLMQAPVFVSYFFGLRSMAKLPVESMKIGGFSWITDLTIPDPYYVMPLVACASLYGILKSGAESGMRLENMKMGRYIVNGIPIALFPFCMNFQSAVLFYWCTNNIISLVLVHIMKNDKVGKYFNIPKRVVPDSKFALPKKGFVDGFRDSIEDQRILKNLEERKQLDEVRFKKAGTGPIPRTYSYDPTRPRPASAASAASIRRSPSK